MNSRTLLITLLLVSLAANLLFAGIVIGRSVPVNEKPHFAWMMQEIDPETRRSLHKNMREFRRDARQAHENLRNAQRHLHETIRQPDYDDQAVEEAFKQVRTASNALQEKMHGQIQSTLGNLDRHERVRVFRFLSERRRPGHDSPGEHRPPPERERPNGD